jgi:hypothetical protein
MKEIRSAYISAVDIFSDGKTFKVDIDQARVVVKKQYQDWSSLVVGGMNWIHSVIHRHVVAIIPSLVNYPL